MRKRERQQLIETLIKQKRLSTQEELVAALVKFGCDVTQATISRDMRELGVQKGTDGDGRVRYILPLPRVRRDPEEVLARTLLESGAEVLQARNLLVIKSEPGTAPTLGRTVDELGNSDIVGTVAGDDTLLVVVKSDSKAEKLAAYMNKLTQV
ncbi:MAG: arginine repressor [Thermoleophilia bacterium]